MDFYRGLLGAPHERRYSGYGSLDSFIRTRLSATQQEELCLEVTDEEVYAVFKSLKKDKALGPDGWAGSLDCGCSGRCSIDDSLGAEYVVHFAFHFVAELSFVKRLLRWRPGAAGHASSATFP
ncbi:hypothetical protein Dimus_026758 [Dionaea muscipula]